MPNSEKTKSQASFEQLCSLLGFSKYNGLFTDIQSTEDAYVRQALDDAIKKLRIDAIYFLRSKKGGPSIPLIYFKLMEYPTASEIADLHKLSWNMGQAPLLFVVLPDTVQIYNNLEPPKKGDDKAGLIDELKVFSQFENERKKFRDYERAEFETGNYWRRNIGIFKTDNSVFRMLLKNLDYMRRILVNTGLSSKIVYSILVRSIFVRYLEDRRDKQGQGVFPNGFFDQFKNGATCFTDLLNTKKATYDFFRFLDDKFNGDIFVVGQDEEDTIGQDHLDSLRRMLKGEEHLDTRQMVLWPLYSFDVIPIELISSIYEQFLTLKKQEEEVSSTGIHYTPYYLVAFLMDEVMPLSDTNINMRIIDATCGSGIFLVEGYRRLVARWMKSNRYQNPAPSELLKILKNSIFGVDLDEKAIRISALSLYLTVCDYLEPKTIWNEVKFERLVGSNLLVFDSLKDIPELRDKFDLVVGNPPWESKLTESAERYVKLHRKRIGDRQICQVFLWKSADLCKPEGKVCMIVSSKALLFNRSSRNSQFRKDFFSQCEIKAIFNLSALRHLLFSHAVGPGAAIVFSPSPPPKNELVSYCSPKPSFTLQDELSFVIEPQDIAQIPLSEALASETIWKTAMWGSPRDHELIRKLSSHPTLDRVARERGWIHGEGYIVGNKRYFTRELLGKLEVSAEDLQKYIVESKSLKRCSKDHFYRWGKEKRQIYKRPHLLIKQSPRKGQGLVSAVMVEDSVFPQSIIGIHCDEQYLSDLIAVCETINSDLPLYYVMLTSGRWLVERDELTKSEIMSIPIPKKILNSGLDMSFLERLAKDGEFREAENCRLMNLYGLDKTEKALVADSIRFTLDYFRHKVDSDAIKPASETDVKKYLANLCQILNHQFSPSSQSFIGTAYSTKGPLRMISLKLVSNGREIVNEELGEEEMDRVLKQLDQELIEERAPGVYVRRHLRRYSKDSVHIIKPNQMRYWTKSSAILDADQVYADIMETDITERSR
ncbi:MAG: N-6 DNA methylase [Promethearchaeati archaeon SRVP18_Atabeyarchaeia-1]